MVTNDPARRGRARSQFWLSAGAMVFAMVGAERTVVSELARYHQDGRERHLIIAIMGGSGFLLMLVGAALSYRWMRKADDTGPARRKS